jgi:hypothetical protein
VTEQTIVRVAGLRGEYTLKSVARNGDVTVFGPVIWSETRRRYIGKPPRPRSQDVKPAYHAVTGDRVDIQQLAMTVRP